MPTGLKVELGPVQQTLLIPLLARALETAKPRGLMRDPRALEIVNSLDYDFTKWEGGRSLPGAMLRARMFDRYVQAFMQEHPHGTITELGCGLDTRFERLDNGEVRWFNLDLPDVIDLRRKFFDDSRRCTMIAASLLDFAWMDQVEDAGGPWMFVSEAVLIYLDSLDARCVLSSLAARFPGATFAFDTTAAKMVDSQASHDAMRHLPRESWFRWRCDDPREIESWAGNLRLLSSETFFDAGTDLLHRMPLGLWLTWRFAPFLLRRQASRYRLNLALADTVVEAG